MPTGKIAVFIDYDNIRLNMKTDPPEKLDEELGYQRMIAWLSEHGEVSLPLVFAPAITTAASMEFFYKLGLIPIACPSFRTTKIETPSLIHQDDFKEYEPQETILINKTDEVMIDVAKRIIGTMSDISHICIASADSDFIPIAELAKQAGKKVMIVFSSLRPSKDLLAFVDKDENNKNMLHLFNPIGE